MVQLPMAWAITLAVNSLRSVALVRVDAVFPKDHAPVVHLLAGVAFFLPAFAGVWWYSFNRVFYGNHKERKDPQRAYRTLRYSAFSVVSSYLTTSLHKHLER